MRRIIVLSLAAAALVGAGGAACAQAGRAAEVTRAQVEQRSAERFDRMDANDDGVLDQADRAARRKAAFDRLDADKDGAISLAEFSARREARAGRGSARAADTDSDGAISKAEFTGAALARFDRIDADRDGTINREERPQRRMMRRGRPAPDAG